MNVHEVLACMLNDTLYECGIPLTEIDTLTVFIFIGGISALFSLALQEGVEGPLIRGIFLREQQDLFC